jgi:hypothetical protein
MDFLSGLLPQKANNKNKVPNVSSGNAPKNAPVYVNAAPEPIMTQEGGRRKTRRNRATRKHKKVQRKSRR